MQTISDLLLFSFILSVHEDKHRCVRTFQCTVLRRPLLHWSSSRKFTHLQVLLASIISSAVNIFCWITRQSCPIWKESDGFNISLVKKILYVWLRELYWPMRHMKCCTCNITRQLLHLSMLEMDTAHAQENLNESKLWKNDFHNLVIYRTI